VIDVRTGQWPTFARAFVRSLIKLLLGGLSFFTMELTRRHQAVHDMLTHTTVQVAESAELVEFRVERVDEPDVVMPSWFRRLAVILLYLVAVLFVYAVSLNLVDTARCIRYDDGRAAGCSAGTQVLVQALSWGWFALSVTVIIVGWKGLLLGARRSRGVSSDVAVA
jgi:hypothetical protein